MSAIIALYLCFTCTSTPHRCEPSWRSILAFILSLIAGVKQRPACICVADVFLPKEEVHGSNAVADKQLPIEERRESIQGVISSVLYDHISALSGEGVLMLTLPYIALTVKRTV